MMDEKAIWDVPILKHFAYVEKWLILLLKKLFQFLLAGECIYEV